MRNVLAFVGDAASHGGPRPFTTALVDELATAVDCDFATFYTVDPVAYVGLDYVPCSRESRLDVSAEEWEGPPTCVDVRRAGVHLWSDTITRDTRYRYRTVWFAEMFELVDSVWTVFWDGPRQYSMLNFHRQGRDFGERERCLVSALRPHVQALIQNAEARRRLADLLDAVDELDQHGTRGFVLLGRDGTLEHASEPARTLLRTWFGSDGGKLPAAVADWLAVSTTGPLRLERGGRRLVVEAPRSQTLLLREEGAAPESLTPRELEVLRLVAAGKSTAGIARDLWVTPATVSKHLEHCYRKLGVGSRTAALAAAGLTARQ